MNGLARRQLEEILERKCPEKIEPPKVTTNGASWTDSGPSTMNPLPFNVCPIDKEYCQNKMLCGKCPKLLNRS